MIKMGGFNSVAMFSIVFLACLCASIQKCKARHNREGYDNQGGYDLGYDNRGGYLVNRPTPFQWGGYGYYGGFRNPYQYDGVKGKNSVATNEDEASIYDDEMDEADNVDEFLSYIEGYSE